MAYRIVSDVSADVSKELLAGLPEPFLIPMDVVLGSEPHVYGPGGDLDNREFYAALRAGKFANLSFGSWQNLYVAETELKDIALSEDLNVAIMTAPLQNAVAEKAADGNCYFAVDALLEPPAATAKEAVNGKLPLLLNDLHRQHSKSEIIINTDMVHSAM